MVDTGDMNLTDLRFLSPLWLWLLLPLWLYLIRWFKATHHGLTHSFADADPAAYNHFYHPLADSLIHHQKRGPQSDSISFWKHTRFWWLGLGFSAFVVALSEPALIGERLPDPPPERDIVFLVDTSVSMQLKDYAIQGKPISRMDVLRNLLDVFATKMRGERLSVIIFAEEPYMLVPLSNDQLLIRRMLKRITTTLAGRYTAVGDALLLALNESQKHSDRQQTFILFTDADKSTGSVTPLAAAKLVADNHIPVYTVAIGSSHQAEQTTTTGNLYEPVDLQLLKSIASVTHGKSFQVNDSQAMQQALDEILSQRQNQAEVIPQFKITALYVYPLIMGLLLLGLYQLLRLLGVRFA